MENKTQDKFAVCFHKSDGKAMKTKIMVIVTHVFFARYFSSYPTNPAVSVFFPCFFLCKLFLQWSESDAVCAAKPKLWESH